VPAQTNARLTRVGSATAKTGGRDDWDQAAGVEPAGANTEKWAGAAPAYYTATSRFTPGPDGADFTATRRLIIDSTVARASGVDADDVVTWTGAGAGTARVIAVSIAELAGIPPELQTARLDLET